MSRSASYKAIAELVNQAIPNDGRVVEFGGSNGVIETIFRELGFHGVYEVASNFPVTDIQSLTNYHDETYDVAIIDQVIEHVPDPRKAVRELKRVLKKDGWLIVTAPFLVPVHDNPRNDYWRFTETGLRKLVEGFAEIISGGWGNREFVAHVLWNGFGVKAGDWIGGGHLAKHEDRYSYTVWVFARK